MKRGLCHIWTRTAHDERNCSASTSSGFSNNALAVGGLPAPEPCPEVNIHDSYLAAATVKVPVPIFGSIRSGKTRGESQRQRGKTLRYTTQRIARPTRDSSKNPQLVGNYNTLPDRRMPIWKWIKRFRIIVILEGK